MNLWVKTTTDGIWFCKHYTSSLTNSSYAIYSTPIATSCVPRVYTTDQTPVVVSTDATSLICDDSWYMVTVTLDINDLKIYVNGVLESQIPGGLCQLSSFNTLIGGRYDNSGVISTDFTGSLDDIGYWNRTLNNCEIQDLFTAGAMIDVTQNDVTLTADQTGATYQWLDCDNNYAEINGETNQSFTSGVTGNYAVEVTLNGCVDTSACFLVDYSGINEIETLVSVHPNPTSDEVNLSVGSELVGTRFTITDNAGRIVLTDSFKATEHKVDLSAFENGVYFIRTDKESQPVKIIKQ